jgi:2-polyprenyl-3-methyl-5-hydroxy-6-metoxy-1,4-benzoquinol methylase
MTSATSCPACHRNSLETLETIRLDVQHRDYSPDETVQKRLTELAAVPRDTYRMLKCKDCGLEFADPLKAPGSGWYELVYSVLVSFPASRWEFEHTLASLRSGDVVGDIGCGSGEFLRGCAERGVAAIGVDFSRSAVQSAVAAGWDAKLLEVGGQTPEFMARGDRDVVVAFQVLEHLDNLGSLFDLARAWAKPSGRLMVGVPSNRRPPRYFAERDLLDQPPHHMTRWTEESLRVIGREHGWNLKSVTHEPLGFAQRVWCVSTRLGIYKALQHRGLLKNRFIERALRAVLLPVSACKALGLKKSLFGQSMLAEYARA